MAELVVGGVTAVWIGHRADAALVRADSAAQRIAYMTQPGIPGTIARRLAAAEGAAAFLIEVPDGDAAKSLAVTEEVCGRLAAAGMERGDLIVAVGGGAVTDLAGFVAAVYLRGIRVHYVPTTLLGAVDAAIGGKTGVNLEAKNLVGVFRHPARVIVDLDILGALSPAARRPGAAEALKAGMVGDAELVRLLERDGLDAPIDEVIERAIRVKAAVVEQDFREAGLRAVLNYGHTVGHALEVAARIGHGEAIAVGMVAAGRASALLLGFDAEDRQRAAIARLGLPIAAPAVDADRIRALLGADKKRSGGVPRMVLLAAIGNPLVAAVDDATVTAALTAVGIGGPIR
ncbi:MAG TPA: 3-dehydroquinate synthase [Actinobacteria bacterium]|nr:3-dehydroquinate synthase [Actinomycetota bacterium]